MSAEKVRLAPREIADLLAMSNTHPANPVVIEWHNDGTADMVDGPEWACTALAKMRSSDVPALQVKCPTCSADPGDWCSLASRPRKNFVHDQRRFKQWQQEHGRPVSKKRL